VATRAILLPKAISIQRSMIVDDGGVDESNRRGAFFNLMGDLAYKALDKLANNSQQWDFTSCHDKSA
jgi:hypothetical protein